MLISVALSGGYTVVKYALTPFLYLISKIADTDKFAYNFDASINQRILPLTEKPDQTFRQDFKPSIKAGDPAPEVELGTTGGFSFPKLWEGKKLLLLLFRGNWCSYSRLHLQDFSNYREAFDEVSVHILAVTAEEEKEWWHAHGIDLQILADPRGDLFEALGVKSNVGIDLIWGRVLPYESVYLFDEKGYLLDTDIRYVSSIKLGQKFSGASSWLKKIISN